MKLFSRFGAIASSFSSIAGTSLSTGLVAYYNFDETSGDLLDQVGSNDGTVNGATQNVSGKIGTAYSFDGVNDLVVLPDASYIDFSSDFTFAIWFKYNGNGGSIFPSIASKWWDGSTRGWNLYLDNSGNLQFVWRPSGEGVDRSLSYSNYSNINGSWHLCIIKYLSGTMYLKIDNTLQDSEVANACAINNATPRLGSYTHTSLNGWLNGSLDECGIWDRGLTADEETELYNSGTGKTYPFT